MRYRTGIQQLDDVLSGGISSGVCEIFGEDSSGKSTLCFSVMREASIRGLPVSLIQSECFPDRHYINNCGVDDCINVNPMYLEAAFKAAYQLIAGGVKVVAIDSITGFECYVDHNNLIVGDSVRYAKTRCVYHGLELLNEEARKRKALILAVNQLRTPIGNLNPKPTSAFYKVMGDVTTTRIRTGREETRNEYGELLYAKIRFDIKKSLKSPPNGRAWGFLFNKRGFDPGFELLRQLIESRSIEPAGSYFRLPNGKTLGPGYMEAALEINKDLDSYRRFYEREIESRFGGA